MLRARGQRWSRSAFFALLIIAWGSSARALEPPDLGGEPSLSLHQLASHLRWQVRWTATRDALEIEARSHRIVFPRHERHFTFDGVRVALGTPIASAQDTLWISRRDYERTLQPLLMPEVFGEPPRRLQQILIDPGHGGKDPGASQRELGLTEKNLTLDLGRRLRKILETRGYTVRMTRTEDRYLTLAERGAMAHAAPTDLFVSLHFNAVERSEVEGVESYVFTPAFQASTARHAVTEGDRVTWPANAFDVWNARLGFEMQRSLVGLPRVQDRGLKRARFGVLRDLPCPGVLVEGGFLSHPREGREIGSAAYRDRLAMAIADALDAFEGSLQSLR